MTTLLRAIAVVLLWIAPAVADDVLFRPAAADPATEELLPSSATTAQGFLDDDAVPDDSLGNADDDTWEAHFPDNTPADVLAAPAADRKRMIDLLREREYPEELDTAVPDHEAWKAHAPEKTRGTLRKMLKSEHVQDYRKRGLTAALRQEALSRWDGQFLQHAGIRFINGAPPLPFPGSTPAEVREMREWWCVKEPRSVACLKLQIIGVHRSTTKSMDDIIVATHRAHLAVAARLRADPAAFSKDVHNMHASWCRVRPAHSCCRAFYYLHPGAAEVAGLQEHEYEEKADPPEAEGGVDPTAAFHARLLFLHDEL